MYPSIAVITPPPVTRTDGAFTCFTTSTVILSNTAYKNSLQDCSSTFYSFANQNAEAYFDTHPVSYRRQNIYFPSPYVHFPFAVSPKYQFEDYGYIAQDLVQRISLDFPNLTVGRHLLPGGPSIPSCGKSPVGDSLQCLGPSNDSDRKSLADGRLVLPPIFGYLATHVAPIPKAGGFNPAGCQTQGPSKAKPVEESSPTPSSTFMPSISLPSPSSLTHSRRLHPGTTPALSATEMPSSAIRSALIHTPKGGKYPPCPSLREAAYFQLSFPTLDWKN